MARRLRLPCSRSQVPQPLTIETDKEGRLTTQSVEAINTTLRALATAINGNLSLGDGTQSEHTGNLDGQTIRVKTPVTIGEEFAVPHGMGRVPIGRIVLGQDSFGSLYDSNRAGWGVDQVFFKCNQSAVTFLLALV
jgi:hypothetical protein